MKIIKRSQLALLSLSFMIMIAGYINYKYDPEREKDLGQTVHVSGADVFLYENASSEKTNVDIYTEKNDIKENSNKTEEQSIETFKADRDDMFSELETTYKEAIANNNDTNIKEKYQEKLDGLVEKKHIISVIENLVKQKGIEDIVIVPTGENINVIIKSKESLEEETIAQIEKLIVDELKIKSSNITITSN